MSDSIDLEEQEIEELLTPSQTQETNEFLEAIKAFQKKEVPISFSFLKEFYKSPRHGIRYYLNKKKPKSKGAEMLTGSLVDAMIEDHFTGKITVEKRFITCEKMPTSENQKGFVSDILSGLTKEEAFSNNYKSGSLNKVWADLGEYIEGLSSGKEAIPVKLFDRAKLIFESLIDNEEVVTLLSHCDKYQNRLEWNYNGWKMKGFTDAEGSSIVVDLKYTKKLEPDKFERDILYTLMFLQGSMYTHSDEGFKKFYLLVYDNDFNFDIMEVDISYLIYGQRLFKHLMNKLEECVKENLWLKSYSFHNFKIVRKVYAPKWLKGFNTEVTEE